MRGGRGTDVATSGQQRKERGKENRGRGEVVSQCQMPLALAIDNTYSPDFCERFVARPQSSTGQKETFEPATCGIVTANWQAAADGDDFEFSMAYYLWERKASFGLESAAAFVRSLRGREERVR